MGVVVAEGTGSAGSDFVARTATEARTEIDTNFGIDWVGTMQDDTMVVPVQPGRVPHFSLSRCQQSFLSRTGMLHNLFLCVLLNYKIYKRDFLGYLQHFANINTPYNDSL